MAPPGGRHNHVRLTMYWIIPLSSLQKDDLESFVIEYLCAVLTGDAKPVVSGFRDAFDQLWLDLARDFMAEVSYEHRSIVVTAEIPKGCTGKRADLIMASLVIDVNQSLFCPPSDDKLLHTLFDCSVPLNPVYLFLTPARSESSATARFDLGLPGFYFITILGRPIVDFVMLPNLLRLKTLARYSIFGGDSVGFQFSHSYMEMSLFQRALSSRLLALYSSYWRFYPILPSSHSRRLLIVLHSWFQSHSPKTVNLNK
jgi:hypothetical protein